VNVFIGTVQGAFVRDNLAAGRIKLGSRPLFGLFAGSVGFFPE